MVLNTDENVEEEDNEQKLSGGESLWGSRPDAYFDQRSIEIDDSTKNKLNP